MIGFSRVPSRGSSGNSSSRNSLLHWRRRASVIVGEVQMQMGGVRGNRGSLGNGQDWDDCREEGDEVSGGV